MASDDIGVAHGVGLASLGLARLPIPSDRAARPTRMPMPRRVYSHNVVDVHIVAREALGYLLGERAMALVASLMFASSCMMLLSFGGGGEDDKVDWPGWPPHGSRTRSSLSWYLIFTAMSC
jgi:hypothetical protein